MLNVDVNFNVIEYNLAMLIITPINSNYNFEIYKLNISKIIDSTNVNLVRTLFGDDSIATTYVMMGLM